MDKRIIVGAVAGVVFGLIMALVGYGFKSLFLLAALGALIGFLGTKTKTPLHYYGGSAAAGILVFILFAISAGGGMFESFDELFTGGIIGLAIGFLTDFIGKKNLI